MEEVSDDSADVVIGVVSVFRVASVMRAASVVRVASTAKLNLKMVKKTIIIVN